VKAALADLGARLGIDAFEHPDRLPWLLGASALAVALALRSRPRAVAWPDLWLLRSAGARRVDGVRGAALALRAAALAALATALAGPIGVDVAPPEPGGGLDLVLAVDASDSMRALDARVGAEPRSRLALAREVVARFARERAAEGDRVALVVFGESAFTQCPLTGDGALLASALARVEAGMAGEATALGDALALAVKRAGGLPEGASPRTPAAGRVVVLLSDGRHNAGALSVEAATALAAAAHVRVHTVAIGSAGAAVAMEPPRAGAPVSGRRERNDVDAPGLRRIAEATGGLAFAAQRSEDLADVYAAIDRLERVPRTLPPRSRRRERPEPLLAAAGSLLAVELAMARVWRRRLP
jgi:Ca-activated chloride channel family protein